MLISQLQRARYWSALMSACKAPLRGRMRPLARAGGMTLASFGLLALLAVLATGVAHALVVVVPEKPGTPTLRVVALDTIEVDWSTPADGGSEILRYLIEYHKAGDDFSISMIVDADKSRPIRIGGLEANATYNIRVAAANRIGIGPYSDESSIKLTPGAIQLGTSDTDTDDTTLPRVIGKTDAATATETVGDRLVITRHDSGGTSFELAVGWIARDGSSQVAIGYVDGVSGVIRDADLGQTYIIVRYEDTGDIVRRWVSSSSPLVGSIPWPIINAQYSFPVGVVAAIPLDHRFPEPNQLARRFEGADDRIFSYDASQLKWRHIPNWPTFQALGFYWCNVTAADEEFFSRIAEGDQHPATTLPAQANYPPCGP